MKVAERVATAVLSLFLADLLLFAQQPTPHPFSIVRGRVEILNPKIKLPRGKADASGVVLWLNEVNKSATRLTAVKSKVSMEQHDKRFSPHVLIVQSGSEVEFPNNDPFFHNVFSVYDGKPFDLGLYASGESRPVRFNRPGISYVFCNIHPQMSAVIITVDTPYFAISAQDGSFIIKDVPLGQYDFRLWHERSDAQQIAARSRTLFIDSPVTDLGIILLDEAGYIPSLHRNKFGEEYEPERNQPGYRRP